MRLYISVLHSGTAGGYVDLVRYYIRKNTQHVVCLYDYEIARACEMMRGKAPLIVNYYQTVDWLCVISGGILRTYQ